MQCVLSGLLLSEERARYVECNVEASKESVVERGL